MEGSLECQGNFIREYWQREVEFRRLPVIYKPDVIEKSSTLQIEENKLHNRLTTISASDPSYPPPFPSRIAGLCFSMKNLP
jgi:hypothetical protein